MSEKNIFCKNCEATKLIKVEELVGFPPMNSNSGILGSINAVLVDVYECPKCGYLECYRSKTLNTHR